MAPRLSIVVPTLNEAIALPRLLGDLAPALARSDVELVVADGGSEDGTVEIARAAGAQVTSGAPGRGGQLRAGVAASHAPIVWILHADVRVPRDTVDGVLRLVAAGLQTPFACRLHIDDTRWSLRLIAWGANLRSRCFALPYGDQSLLVPRSVYDHADGYEDIPLMEDVSIARRLRAISPIRLLPFAVHVSARRWLRDGPWRRSTRNVGLLLRYLAGADPRALAARYRGEGS